MIKTLSRIETLESYKWVMAIAIFAALLHFIAVFYIVISRIGYRYDLEWVDGASLVQVYRIYTGQPLYIQPSLEYIPMIYPPFYFYISAVVAKFTGISFLPLRLVSFASAVGSSIVIYCAVNDKTRSKLISLVSGGSFVATFRLGGAWFDIARVDMLFLFLCLAGIYFLGKQSTYNSIIAGILFSLALLTKQTAFPIFIVAAFSTLLLFRKQTIPFVGSFTILALITYLYLNSSTDGWYQYFNLTVPASFQIRFASVFSILLSSFAVELVVFIIGFSPLLLGIRKVIQDKLHLYYYLMAIGFITASVIARMGHEAYDNNILPSYAGLAILFGMGIGWLTLHFNIPNITKNMLQTVLWLAIALQFVLLVYNPIQQIPTLADRNAGDALVSKVQSASGEVLIPYHNYLALFAGKKVYFHFVALDGVRSLHIKTRPELRDILQQFHSTSFSLFIMDLPDNLIQNSHCAKTENIGYESSTTFIPVTGYSVRPTIQYSDCP
jgi:4-amino-4-deoxy-L-arabinose transferase-like glycosyltransferase